MKKLGLIVNPVAGIGGKVGLKGSDGTETLLKALALGACPECEEKTAIAIEALRPFAKEFELYTYPKEMGENIAKSCGLKPTVLGDISEGKTTPQDTVQAAKDLQKAGVDLILFAGGDGTARNVLDAVGTDTPALGIPAGCKIHSAVYAINPKTAGELLAQFIQGKVCETRMAEVMDIDEDLFRKNVVNAKLYGYLKVPNAQKMVQNMKSGRGYSESGSIAMLSRYIADSLENDTLYIIGPGSTTKSIMDAIGLSGTLLGVDVFYCKNNGKKPEMIGKDATEMQILNALKNYPKAKIIVTVIGGQGYVFGRGNQQISADVIEKVGRQNIMVAASKDKMLSLFGKQLYVDTGKQKTNAMLRGYFRVVVGYEDSVMFPVTD